MMNTSLLTFLVLSVFFFLSFNDDHRVLAEDQHRVTELVGRSVEAFTSAFTSWFGIDDYSRRGGRSDGSSFSSRHPWTRFRRHHSLSLTRKSNVTCPELNVTFTNEPPFDVLGVPECGEKVQPKFMLYLPPDEVTGEEDIQCQLDPAFLPNRETTLCFEALKRQEAVAKVVILIHGFLKNFDTEWLHEVQRDIQEVDPNTAVIIIGWGHGMEDIFSFWRAASNTRYIAQAMFQLIKEMHTVVDRQLFVHCAGHSLGGQACGFAGKHLLAADATSQLDLVLDRISGMDPAGPLFCNDVPYPFNHLDIAPTARLGPHDARLVDVIHTDGDARYLGILPQYGTMEPLGTVDFYPGTAGEYGHDQPGCLDVINVISCSHSRARLLFQSSVKEEVCLASKQCFGDPHLIPKTCVNFTRPVTVSMGYWWDIKNPMPGMFLVEEGSRFPYCATRTAKTTKTKYKKERGVS